MPAYGQPTPALNRIAGMYYGYPPLSNAAAAIAANRMTLLPAPMRAGLYDRIGARVTVAAAGSTVRLGVYDSDDNGQPRTLLLDAGTIDGNSATIQTITIALTLPAHGVYWLASVSQGGTPTVAAINSATAPSLPASYTSDPQASFHGFFQDSVTGALPGTVTFAAANALASPVKVMLRAA